MEEDQPWYDDLLDYGKEQIGSIQAEGEIAGFDVTFGRMPGPSWTLVAAVMFLLLILIVVAGR